ncbi:cytochrome P450 [Streptomyces sp. NBC_01803]|uniref:cytochrome P450 n=1 Tax=Streptomyces sp. NBC_01803 TaxID=2975946 RepID=UPI002DDC2C28|nr:cytochrome P450 [Streptomyces sp. NBC_01803]WSA42977.1 cytochrome P450 [Streptomyces sp. NBC_01803]
MSDQVTATGALPSVLDGFDLTDHNAFAASPEGFPHGLFERLRREAPVLRHPPGRSVDAESFWVLSRHADIAAAAGAPEVFSPQGGGGRAGGGSHLDDMPVGVYAGVMLPMMDNPRHDLIKDLLTPAATGPVAAAVEKELRGAAAGVVEAALDRGTCDLATDIVQRHTFLGIAVLLGIPAEDRDRLADWAAHSTGLLNRRTGLPDERAMDAWQGSQEYIGDLLAARRAEPAEDLASVLANGRIAGDGGEAPLTDHERRVNAQLLLLHGGEQPRNTFASGLLGLAGHPGQWRAVREDRALLAPTAEEVLRWAPPNPYNRRTATRDVRVGGELIRAGEKVTLWWPSGNRDENVFPAPSTFDQRRSPNPHLTFGHGGGFCLGGAIARFELRILLDALLDRVAEIRQAGAVTYQPSNKHTVVLDMPVELIPR